MVARSPNFTVRSFEDFNTKATSVTGGVLASHHGDGRMVFTSANIGQCQISGSTASAYRASIPARSEYAGINDPLSFIFFISGAASFHTEEFSESLPPSAVVVHSRSRHAEGRAVDDTEHFQLNFPRSLLSPQIQRHTDKTLLLKADSVGIAPIFRTLVRSVFEQREALPDRAKSKLQTTLVGLAADLIASAIPEDELVGTLGLASIRARAMCLIEAQLEKIKSVEELAGHLGCSTRHIHNAFAERNTTPARYIWSLRLDRARDLITAATLHDSILDIAFSCGFKSYAHFSRSFKQRFGLPPRAFWKQMSRDDGDL